MHRANRSTAQSKICLPTFASAISIPCSSGGCRLPFSLNFHEPLFKQAMNRVYEEMQAHLAYLSEHPLAPDRDERIRHLVDCPQPLQNLLTSRFPESDDQMRQIMLEVLTRRYYRIRWLKNVECTTVDGQTIVKAAYDYNGASIVAVTTFARYEDLAAAATALGGLIRQIPHEHDIV